MKKISKCGQYLEILKVKVKQILVIKLKIRINDKYEFSGDKLAFCLESRIKTWNALFYVE